MRYILAHDLGTTGNKATLLGEDGVLRGGHTIPYDTRYFNEIWAEQDPEAWWRAVCDGTRSLLRESGVSPQAVAAISFSGQMMGCVCVDRRGRPLRNAIIWADQRAQEQAAAIAARIAPEAFYRITGHRNSASYGLQKLMWVRDHEPEVYRETFKTLNAKDYILLRLTGRFCTDPSDATGNACLDLARRRWSEEIISTAGIDGEKLPQIVPSAQVAGVVTEAAAKECGLRAGTPVVPGGGDGVCANVGAGSIRPGQTFSYIGSSAWVASTSEAPVLDAQMRTVTWAHLVDGLYAPNGTMQCAGSAYQWARDCLFAGEAGAADVYARMNQLAGESPPGARGVLFLPHLLGERAPRWNPHARGAFVGLKMENSRADMLRAVLEGVTMNLGLIVDALRAHLAFEEITVIGGGAKSGLWRQMMADIYGVGIRSPRLLEEATSLGAAVAGGVGVGLFDGCDVAQQFLETAHVHEPSQTDRAAYAPVRALFEECYQALAEVHARMARENEKGMEGK